MWVSWDLSTHRAPAQFLVHRECSVDVNYYYWINCIKEKVAKKILQNRTKLSCSGEEEPDWETENLSVHSSSLPLIGFMTLDKSCNLCRPHFSHLYFCPRPIQLKYSLIYFQAYKMTFSCHWQLIFWHFIVEKFKVTAKQREEYKMALEVHP